MTSMKGQVLRTNEQVRDVSEVVYRLLLGPDDVARMIAKDKDKGEALRVRAKLYDTLSRTYIKVLLNE